MTTNENSPTIVHNASVVRTNNTVSVTFGPMDSNGEPTMPYSIIRYRKTWSIKKYVDTALAERDYTPAWDFTYSYSM